MKPVISVCVPTFNQEKYIEKCLESILDQDIEVPYEIIVADDCSTDATREILMGYGERYEGIIKLILNNENIGPTQNTLLARSHARGKYICHCDGDDFFYREKLRVQFDFLGQNPEYVVAWHDVHLYRECGDLLDNDEAKLKKNIDLKLEDLLAFGSWGANSSLMYRYNGIPFETDKYVMYDFEFSLILLDNSKGVLLSNKLGGYRVGSVGSLTSSLLSNRVNRQRLDQLRLWAAFVRKRKEYRKFVGFFSLITLFKSLLKREKISKKYFTGIIYLMYFAHGPSLINSVLKKISK